MYNNLINLTNKFSIQIMIITLMILINLILSNKILLWMTLEISTMSFISMIIMAKNYNSSIMYFIISFISSTIMFVSLMYNPSINMNILIMISVMIKIAMFPFNYWFNLMSKSISYMNLGILMTLMKFIPMNIMHMMTEMNNPMLLIILTSMIISPIMTINKYSLKLILSYSSIHQTSMMILMMYMNFYMFVSYFIMYSIITMNLSIILNKMTNTLKYEFIMNKKMKTMFFLLMVSYSYFPPMTTFMMKWSLIENLIMMNIQFKLMSIIVMMSSFVMIWSYMNFMNNNIYNFNNFNKMFTKTPLAKSQKNIMVIYIMTLTSFMYMYINF